MGGGKKEHNERVSAHADTGSRQDCAPLVLLWTNAPRYDWVAVDRPAVRAQLVRKFIGIHSIIFFACISGSSDRWLYFYSSSFK